MLYDNQEDPYQLVNLIDDADHGGTREHLDGLMRTHMASIDDEFLTREEYYERLGIEFDNRGKVVDLVKNMYDRSG